MSNAVYAYIRALRTLGRKQLDVAEVSQALGLSVEAVTSALAALESKGVKFL
jgi:predicted transcriptional regulator